MPRPRPLPPQLGSAFSTADALAAGATHRRLRAKDLDRPFHGARRRKAITEADAEGPLASDRRRRAETLERARAYATVMPAGSFFCGRTAACLRGAPINPGERLDVACFTPAHGPRGRGIRGRKVAPHLATVEMIDGLPMTSPATTWAMLGRELSERDLVILGDAFVRVPRDHHGRLLPASCLATVDELRAALDAGPRPGSAARLRRALDQVRVGSASPPETEFRLDAAAAGLPEPELDVEIRSDDGRLLGISEIAFPRFRTAVEIEGDHHRVSREQWDRDIAKYEAYESAGWHPVRLTTRHIRHSRHGISIVAAALQVRG